MERPQKTQRGETASRVNITALRKIAVRSLLLKCLPSKTECCILKKSRDTQVLGTIGYAPPEQLGIGQSDHRADIYALGVLLNVMLTGRHPSQTLAKGRAGRIIRKCTQVDPGSRYQTVGELIDAL